MNSKRSFLVGFVAGVSSTFILVVFLLFILLPHGKASPARLTPDPRTVRLKHGHIPPAPKELTIIQARYGSKDNFFDVTDAIKAKIKNNTLSLTVSNTLAGDPAHGEVKTLDVEYIVDGQPKSASIPEGGVLEIPALSAIGTPEELMLFVEACPFELGFFAKDLRTGKTIEHRPDQPACMASIVKLFTLLEVMRQVQEGQLALEDMISIKGQDTTVSGALDLMIGLNDNASTNALTARVGYDRVNLLPEELGMEGVSAEILPKPDVLDDALNQRVSGPRALPRDVLPPQHATARAMVRYFELLDSHQLLSPEISRRVLDVLKRHPREFVTEVPAGANVVGKGGSLGWNGPDDTKYTMFGWNAYVYDDEHALAFCVWCEWFPKDMPDKLQVKWCTEISNAIVSVLLNESRTGPEPVQ